MLRVLLALVAFAVGAALAWLLYPRDAARSDAAEAFARAKAYYLNETNADYRRARTEIQALADDLGDSAAFHLDMALLDLQEINYRVQDQDRAFSQPDYQRLLRSALAHLQRARVIDPGNEAVDYNLARTYRKLAPNAENGDQLLAEAERLLEPLARKESPDPSTLLLYGDLLFEKRDLEKARAAFGRIEAMGKDYVPRTIYFVALNKLSLVSTQTDPAAAAALRERIEREYPDKPKANPGALERGRYTDLIDLGLAAQVAPRPEALAWERVSDRVGLPAPGEPRFLIAPDVDGDCSRDLLLNGEKGLRLLRNRRNATFDDLTRTAGLPADFVLAAAAAGDVDGDGRCDLALGGPRGLRLFLNRTAEDDPGNWRFEEAVALPDGTPVFDARAEEPVTSLAFWDLDHDGDLDLFAGGARNRLYLASVEQLAPQQRHARFAEAGQRLGVEAPPADHALILDLEDDQDVDLLVTGPAGNAWFENLRELRLSRRELPPGLGLEAADIDNDLLEEVRIGTTAYKWREGRLVAVAEHFALVDLDGDGVIDTAPQEGLAIEGSLVCAIDADLNRDGSPDLLTLTDRALDLHLSIPGPALGWIDVQPRGLKTNEYGIGTSIRLFAGDLRIGATCRDGLVNFTLGRRPIVDALMLRWTNGVEQGVVTPLLASCVHVEEREGEVGSCPFLYAFDGERWHFVADCHSGTPLGLPVATGVYLPPRPNETILVPGAMLRPRDGLLRLDLAEEFRELFYADQVVLRAIDRPATARPVLNEGFKVSRFPEFRVHCLDDLRAPRAAHDQSGRDILGLVRERDGRHWRGFEDLDSRYEGLAREWAITLDFGDLEGARRVLLVMDGWVEFPTASASIAASQSKSVRFLPPVLEAAGEDGQWQVVDPDAGFPAGKGKSVLVDLTGKVPHGGRLRLRGTQRIHWDAFLVSTGEDLPHRLTELPLLRAEHRFRGVGRRVVDPAGEQPWRYSHDDLVSFVPYDQMPPGLVTRYGDVRALLASIDDRYPILASGDVVELAFDAAALPPLPEGWERDYCFTTEGWVKDADMNQAIRERVGPLPFRAMSRYPYDEAVESHPHPDFVAEWLTRPTRRLVDPAAIR